VDRADIREALADEREQLVSDVRDIEGADWDRPSLCEGWAVRDVIGHLIRVEAYYRYAAPFFIGLLRYGLRINTCIARDARKRAAGRSSESLVADLAATRYETTFGARLHPFSAIPLAELIIHGQDIRRALGMGRRFPIDRLIAVANMLARPGRYPWGRGRRTNAAFEATDADWRVGTGEVVRAPLEEIVVTLAGRRISDGPVTGG
jgi:uncharacterized protein (TIGR03083 family)